MSWSVLSFGFAHQSQEAAPTGEEVPAQLNPVVLHVGASGAAPDWSECSTAQQFHILGTPATTACATWCYPSGALSPAKAHQGLYLIESTLLSPTILWTVCQPHAGENTPDSS